VGKAANLANPLDGGNICFVKVKEAARDGQGNFQRIIMFTFPFLLID
jgi:hypothetical protein